MMSVKQSAKQMGLQFAAYGGALIDGQNTFRHSLTGLLPNSILIARL